MNIKEIERGDIVILAPEGRLDSNSSPGFEQCLIALIEKSSSPKILIDCTVLDYISSAGLRVLLLGAKRLKSGPGQLVLCALSKNVQQVFKMSGFERLFIIADNQETALAEFQDTPAGLA